MGATIEGMTETPPPTPTTPPSSEPTTGPITPQETAAPQYAPPPANVGPYPAYDRKPSRLNQVAAWVGITAGVVFIVAVIFGSGFVLGAHSGGHHRGGPDRGEMMMHRQGPPPMFPMGPMLRPPGPGFVFPGGPGGNMGPGDSSGSGESGQGPSSMLPTQPR
jgi:hypothetical protein